MLRKSEARISRAKLAIVTVLLLAAVIASSLAAGSVASAGISTTETAPQAAQPAAVQVSSVPGGATFVVTYTGFPADARAAFQRAVDTWAERISSHVPIAIDARWQPLGQDALGQASAVSFIKDFANTPRPGAWFNIALANSIIGTDQAPAEADIVATFNSDNPNWHFGPAATPAGKFDLETVVLHELAHGLGFDTTFTMTNPPTDTIGKWGSAGNSNAFDDFLVNLTGQSLTNESLFPNPSLALGNQLRGNNVYFSGPQATAANDGFSVRLHAPATWDEGGSIVHLHSSFGGGADDLMINGFAPGEQQRNVGPVTVGILKDLGWAIPGIVNNVTAGAEFTCALILNGTVACWGDNFFGQLGLGDTENRGGLPSDMGNNLPSLELGTGRVATLLASGSRHSCALLDNNSVKCWGANARGQLGLGDKVARGDGPGEMGDTLPTVSLGPGTVVELVAGDDHTCVRFSDRSVKCWGDNPGTLGLGDTNDRGDNAGEMGIALPAVNAGTGSQVDQLAAGSAHTCALLGGGSVKCWGYNAFGQLGLGDVATRGDQAGEMGDALPAVNLGGAAVEIAAGYHHSCARLQNGSVKCWGHNDAGQLGLGDTDDRGDEAGEMGASLPGVSLGPGRTATAIAAGGDRTCALLDDSSVKCWGANAVGQLGLGDTANRGDGPGEMGASLPAVSLGAGPKATGIDLGDNHTCVWFDQHGAKCWGDNSLGRLGLGDLDARGDGPNEMGFVLPFIDLGEVAVPPQGDVVCDGVVDLTDAVAVIRKVAGLTTGPVPTAPCTGDVNGDQAVTANDALSILRQLAGVSPA
ncbi:hypothetical protein AYO38_01790 [bacterium SCGC AG-212-C10]|nr:hypothetical protein AYO38_01790 [bacterium SCGC AG-212-C10]